MKSLLKGILVAIFIKIIAFIIKNETFFILISQILGYGSFAIGVVLSGLLSDSIYRRTATETKEERHKRLSISSKFILFGIPNIISLFIFYNIQRKG